MQRLLILIAQGGPLKYYLSFASWPVGYKTNKDKATVLSTTDESNMSRVFDRQRQVPRTHRARGCI